MSSDTSNINLSSLSNLNNSFKSEKNKYNSYVKNVFNISYLNNCSDSVVRSMASKLNRKYTGIEKGYKNISKWFDDYVKNTSLMEKYMSSDSKVSSATESTIKNYLDSKLNHELTEKKLNYHLTRSSDNKSISENNTSNNSNDINKVIKNPNMTLEEKLKIVYPDGVPTTKEEVEKYLTTVEIPITTKDGEKTTINVTVHKALANDVKEACKAAEEAGFVIYSIGGYRGYNNGDNLGQVKDSNGNVIFNQSQHNYGLAIDINPDENCQIKDGKVLTGVHYKPGEDKYSIKADSELIKSFKSNGWSWGGDWKSSKDYMHFSFFGT